MQKKRHSLLEAILSTAIGFIIAFISNIVIMYAMGFPLTLTQNFVMTCFFTVVSIIRGYYVRRLFNHLHVKKILI